MPASQRVHQSPMPCRRLPTPPVTYPSGPILPTHVLFPFGLQRSAMVWRSRMSSPCVQTAVTTHTPTALPPQGAPKGAAAKPRLSRTGLGISRRPVWPQPIPNVETWGTQEAGRSVSALGVLWELAPQPPCRLQALLAMSSLLRNRLSRGPAGPGLQPPRCPCRPGAPSGKCKAWSFGFCPHGPHICTWKL